MTHGECWPASPSALPWEKSTVYSAFLRAAREECGSVVSLEASEKSGPPAASTYSCSMKKAGMRLLSAVARKK